MKKNKKYIIDSILVVIAIVCFGCVGVKYYNYHKDKMTYNDVKKLKPIDDRIQENSQKDSATEENDDIKKEQNQDTKEIIQEEKLRKINDDYKFWIEIPDTNIDYPIVQSSDNDYYLHKNFNKESSSSGSIFLDYRNDICSDRNLLIYGHHMKNGTMFADVVKYKEKDFFDNKRIKIIKNNKEYIYEVFSVFVVDGNYEGLKVKFDSDEDYFNYIEELKEKSLYKKDVSSDYSDIITLFTCSYEFDSARTIVCATLLN